MGDSSEDEQIDEYDECGGSERLKDLVHKSHSDPGKVTGRPPAPSRYPILPTGPTTRKCVLTLDGYSYVIGKSFISTIFSLFYKKNLIKTAPITRIKLAKTLDAESVKTTASKGFNTNAFVVTL